MIKHPTTPRRDGIPRQFFNSFPCRGNIAPAVKPGSITPAARFDSVRGVRIFRRKWCGQPFFRAFVKLLHWRFSSDDRQCGTVVLIGKANLRFFLRSFRRFDAGSNPVRPFPSRGLLFCRSLQRGEDHLQMLYIFDLRQQVGRHVLHPVEFGLRDRLTGDR